MVKSMVAGFFQTNVSSLLHFSHTQQHRQRQQHFFIYPQEYDRIEKRIEILTRKLSQLRDVDDMVRSTSGTKFCVSDPVDY